MIKVKNDLRRIMRRMRQLYRMYRMAKIIEISEEKKDAENKGKDLVKILEDGLQPDIGAVKLAFQAKHNYSFTVARRTYKDLVDNKMVKEYDKTIKLQSRPSLKVTKYTELNSQGRSLIDRFILPWGADKGLRGRIRYCRVYLSFVRYWNRHLLNW